MYRQGIKILLISSLFFIIPEVAQAGFLDDIACIADGDCNLEDIAAGFNSLIRILLGAMGAVALLFFVWGGIQWLVSGGNPEKVNRGKDIMVNTVFAIILSFGSYLIVSFFINDVLNVTDGSNGTLDLRVTEGEFIYCKDAPRGQSCGDGKTQECSGLITEGPYTSLSEKCLYKCQLETIKNIGLAECHSSLFVGWEKVDGANLCPSQQICISSTPLITLEEAAQNGF